MKETRVHISAIYIDPDGVPARIDFTGGVNGLNGRGNSARGARYVALPYDTYGSAVETRTGRKLRITPELAAVIKAANRPAPQIRRVDCYTVYADGGMEISVSTEAGARALELGYRYVCPHGKLCSDIDYRVDFCPNCKAIEEEEE